MPDSSLCRWRPLCGGRSLLQCGGVLGTSIRLWSACHDRLDNPRSPAVPPRDRGCPRRRRGESCRCRDHLDQLHHRERSGERRRARRLRHRQHGLRGDLRRPEHLYRQWCELDQPDHGERPGEQQRARRLCGRQHDLRGDDRRPEHLNRQWCELDQPDHGERPGEQHRVRCLRGRQHGLRRDRP